MMEKHYDEVLKEYFDTTNRSSMKMMLALNESEQNKAMVALASKLYEKIVAKVDDIDYGTIPASKGDITKIGNFMEMRDCMNTIREILTHYKQDTNQLDIIDRAIENLKDSKKIWEKAFIVKCEIAITFYNTIALSIVSAVSLLISSSIDFIKEPGNQSFEVSFDRVGYTKTKDKLLFQNLDDFNKSYVKGDIDKLFRTIVDTNANVKESAIEPVTEAIALGAIVGVVGGVGVGIWALLKIVIPIMHQLTNALYCAKQSVSEYFELQSKLLQFNAENLKYTYTKSEDQLEKIYKKQSKIAEMFKNLANKFAVKMNKADSDARKLIEKEKKEKYNAEDLEVQDAPTMTSSIF